MIVARDLNDVGTRFHSRGRCCFCHIDDHDLDPGDKLN